MHLTYQISTQDGYHIISVEGDPIARVRTVSPISSTTEAWPTAFEVCAEAGLPKPRWLVHAGDVIYIGFTDKSPST